MKNEGIPGQAASMDSSNINFGIQFDGFLKRLLTHSHIGRTLFFVIFDSLIIICSLKLSFFLRGDFVMRDEYLDLIASSLPVFIIGKLLVFSAFRMYNVTWRYAGIRDLCDIVGALFVSELILMVAIMAPFPTFVNYFLASFHNVSLSGFPGSIFFIDGVISLVLLSGLRISKRVYLEVIQGKRLKKGLRTIIIGAGCTGEMILRDMMRWHYNDFYPIGFLDDDQLKVGDYVHGVKVLDTTSALASLTAKHEVEAVIIAIPSLNYSVLRSIYSAAKDAGIKFIRVVPRIYDFHTPDVRLKNLEEIKIEDLIGRQAIEVDHKEIKDFLEDRVVLITGAGGSIGSEIVSQVCSFNPEKVILFEIDETWLHNVKEHLRHASPNMFEKVRFVVGDVKDEQRVRELFSQHKPQIIFHAAAYKHVPMMENNPKEAVKVNIFGTYNLAKNAVEHGAEKFIMISTDKAVRPTSVMGATKRIAEYICGAFNGAGAETQENPAKTEFISVRFGNVLGSRGSVLPMFLKQIKKGGPLTVTHKDMQRYFMTIPEAVSLVLQASVIGKGGEVLVLDMGDPVKIIHLAEELIRIHGMEPYKDIDIQFTGMRPGEKLLKRYLRLKKEHTRAVIRRFLLREIARSITLKT